MRARIPALLALVTLAYCWRYLTPGYFFFEFDVGAFAYPRMEFAKHEVLAGRLPLWDPYRYCGVPFMANVQSGLFYPLYWTGLLVPTERFLTLFLVFHLWWGALGMYAYCRRSGLSREAALLGALGFAFGGSMIPQLTNVMFLAALSWFPWLVVALEADRPFTAALLLSLQTTCGQPQAVLIGLPAVLLLFSFDGNNTASAKEKLMLLGKCLAAALLTASVVWMPALEFMGQSSRQNLPMLGFNDQYSLDWKSLPSVIFPEMDLSHLFADETTLYFIPSALLALAVLPWLRRPATADGAFAKRRAILLTIAGFAFLLALGPRVAICRWLLQTLPGYRLFRAPIRWLFLACASVSILAAMGWDCLRPYIRSVVLRRVLIVAIALDVLLLGAFAYPPMNGEALREPATSKLARPIEDGRVFLVPYLDFRDFNWCLVTRTFTATGYDPLAIEAYLQYVAYAARGRLMDDHDRANLSFNINMFPWSGYDPRMLSLLSVSAVIGSRQPHQALEVRQITPLPRWYLVGAYEVVDDMASTFARIKSEKFPLGRTVLLDRAPSAPLPARPGEPGKVLCETFLPGRIELRTEAADPSILVLSESWYPGWKASVDGQPVDLYRAYWIMRAVQVPAGTHHVELVFDPWTLKLGGVLTLLGLIVCCVGVLRYEKRDGGGRHRHLES